MKSRINNLKLFAFIALAPLFVVEASWAENAVSPEKAKSIATGELLAQKHCAQCHSIGKTGKSPISDAPVFRGFAAKWPLEYLEEALAEGIVVGHSVMPEFEFETKDITNLLDYIGSVANKT